MQDRATTLFLRYRRSGDGKALGRLFDLVGPEMLRVARHLGASIAGAEDLVQSTFLSAMERAHTFESERAVRPWLFGILIREAARTRQAEARTPDLQRLTSRDGEDSPLDAVLGAETAALVGQAIQRLPQHYRDVLDPHLLRGQSATEIALRAGRESGQGPSSAQVRVQIARGLERLRRMLPGGLSLGAVGALSAGRGEAAVRRAIVEAARSMPAAAATGPASLTAATVWIPTGLLMGKALIALAGIATAAVATLALHPGSEGSTDLSREDTLEVAESEATELVAPEKEAETRISSPKAQAREFEREATPSFVDATLVSSEEKANAPWAGVVLEANGEPARDAWVEVRFTEEEFAPLRVRADATTGRFTLPIPDGTPYVAGHAPGRASAAVVALTDDARSEPIQLHLRGPGSALRLRILDDEDEPIEGARVSVREDGAGGQFQARGFKGPDWRWSAASNADGEALFTDLFHVGHTVKVAAPGHERPLLHKSFLCPPLEPGKERFLEVKLELGAVLVGRVTSEDGTPLEGSFIQGPGGDGRLLATSGPDGRFELRGLQPGEQEVHAGNNHLRQVRIQRTLRLDTDRVERWDPVLRPQRRLSGTLVDHLGAPLVGWSLRGHTDDFGSYYGFGYSGAGGEFTLTGVPEGAYFVTAQSVPGYDRSLPIGVFQDFDREGADVRLVLPESALALGVVQGRVRYADGAPVESVRLLVFSLATGWGSFSPLEPDGSFRAASHFDGEYRLGFVQGDDLNFPMSERTLQFVSGQVLDLGEIVLEKPGRRSITPSSAKYPVASAGTDSTGLPGTFRWMLIRDAEGRGPGAMTDLPWPLPEPVRLPPGEYRLKLQASHFRADPTRITIRSGQDTELRIPLQSATELRFTFVSESGVPFSGEVDLQILHIETRTELQRLTVPAGEPLVLDLEPMPGGRTFLATATDEKGTELQGSIGGCLSGGYRSNHDFTIQLLPR
ncbi:sigma-70 family RNA polymerase sigma factor [Planctomycetes bacterium Poly30]|uniref:sigma-70 family RNA polymerase sigma factor n=1 Tax=Saltatorellus ferox TaxID=2528018 RepID=UPI00119E5B0B